MTYQKNQILSRLQDERDFMRKSGVKRIGLFGSAAREEDHEGSDLDFLVEMDRPSFDGYMDVKFRLEDLFQRRVDLVLAHQLKPRLRQKILAETIYATG
jgi:predicted nucleotidyltransferase